MAFGESKTSSSLQVSAIGSMYYELKEKDGPVVSAIDVSGGPKEYELTVKTPCGDGLEKGALISLELDNGSVSSWSSSETLNQDDTNIGTMVVSEDRRAGGNVIAFMLGDDGVSSFDSLSLTLTTRNGQINSKQKEIIDIQD